MTNQPSGEIEIPEWFNDWLKEANPCGIYEYNIWNKGAISAYRHLSGRRGWIDVKDESLNPEGPLDLPDNYVNFTRLKYLEHLINSPEIEDFLKGVQLEAAHQTERWTLEAEEKKMPQHYACVMAKLTGKLAVAIFDGDIEKYKHHLITLAAVCHNIHRQIDKPGTLINKYFHHNHTL